MVPGELMKAKYLLEILQQHPERHVLLSSPLSIDHIAYVDQDCFDAEEGTVWVLEPDHTED